MTTRLRWLAIPALAALCACATIERAALPEPTPHAAVWFEAADAPGELVDHDPWDAFLATRASLDGDGVARVDYGAVTPEERAAVRRYLSALEEMDPRQLTRDAQLAYWINLYNAATVEIVLDAYPVASIRKITDGPLSFGPWDRPVATVLGRPLTLNDIEHRIIRPVYGEPRIHYALNCAAVSCPNLRKTAWRANTLDADLEAAERAYVADPRGVLITPNGDLTLSKIYVWFREDFGDDEAAILRRLAEKAPPGLAATLSERTRVDRYAYDWSLNDAALAP